MKRTKTVRKTLKGMEQQLARLFEENRERVFSLTDLFHALQACSNTQKEIAQEALQHLVLQDYVATDGNGHYRNAARSQVMEGTFYRKHNGHNAFIPDDGGKSILVFERNSHHALDGDRVRVTMAARRRNHAREAEVIEVVKRKRTSFVGRLKVERNYGLFLPETRTLPFDIFIPKEKLKGGKTGDKAVVAIDVWPEDARSPMGRVIDILGREGDNDAEMHAILAEFELPYSYPKSVEAAAEKLVPGITDEETRRREDFRNVTTFTIDPRDAKDFDDALSIRTTDREGVWEVGVHIADVSHYVKEGDIIDREAQKRATSIYLVDRTIPMLPERLCNFICSLRPDEDKLAYSVIFQLKASGEIVDWHLAHTVIRSDRRFTYEEVQFLLEQHGEASPEDLKEGTEHPEPIYDRTHPTGEFASELIRLNSIAKELRKKRFASGAIGFDRSEVRFEINDKGHPVSTYTKVAKDANKLVEEFMLLANRTVAESVGRVPKGKKAKTLPYRIHDVPDPDKLEKLRAFSATFGYRIHTEGSKKEVARSLNKLLADARGKKEQSLIELVALRSMQKAQYSTENIGHYGLMFDYYTHFTSPIRRYPDLMVHRLLTRYAEGGRSASAQKYEELCEHASQMEILATSAERASIKYKQVEYLQDRLNQVFTGKISGVTEFGIYVELDDNKCEGMVSLRDLADDYYELDERNYCLIGRKYHRRYALGDAVTIRVERANLERKQIDFSLIDDDGYKPDTASPQAQRTSRKQPS